MSRQLLARRRLHAAAGGVGTAVRNAASPQAEAPVVIKVEPATNVRAVNSGTIRSRVACRPRLRPRSRRPPLALRAHLVSIRDWFRDPFIESITC